MPEPHLATRIVPAYHHLERLLCPTCAQAAILPSTEGAQYDDTERAAAASSDAFPTPIPAAEALNQTCAECGTRLLEADYWTLYHAAMDAVAAEADSVDALIAVLNHFYRPESGEAFHPGGGDRDLWEVLRWERSDWTTVWSKASYWYAMRDSQGNTFTFTEGDIDRGMQP